MKAKGRHYDYVVVYDPWTGLLDDPKHVQKVQRSFNSFWSKIFDRMEEPMKITKVYEVWAFYGGDPKNIVTIPSGSPFVFADDEQEATIKSGIYGQLSSFKSAADLPLDPEFITIVVNQVGTIKVSK